MNKAIYQLPISETLSMAWQKTRGVKGTIWTAIFLMLGIMVAAALIEGVFNTILPELTLITALIIQIINFLAQMGILYIGLKLALGNPVDYTMMFLTFNWHIAWKVIVLNLIEFIIVFPFFLIVIFLTKAFGGTKLSHVSFYAIGFISILGLIYFLTRLSMATAFILDRASSPWLAIKQSFTVTRRNFLQLFLILILQFLILLVSLIPLGIPLIWTVPFVIVLYGEMYRRLSVNLT